MSKTSYLKILPPTWLLIALLLMLGLHFGLPVAQILPVPWILLGLVPLFAGIIISTLAERDFQRAKTTIHPFKIPSNLVTTGFFRLSRNPMYLGFVFILTGVATLLGSLTPFGVILLFIWWITTQFIHIEEQNMAAQFGSDWLEYKAQVRRWI